MENSLPSSYMSPVLFSLVCLISFSCLSLFYVMPSSTDSISFTVGRYCKKFLGIIWQFLNQSNPWMIDASQAIDHMLAKKQSCFLCYLAQGWSPLLLPPTDPTPEWPVHNSQLVHAPRRYNTAIRWSTFPGYSMQSADKSSRTSSSKQRWIRHTCCRKLAFPISHP